MRTLCPSSSRSLLSARLPFTRSSPLRTMRWMWENDRPGKRASRKRSTRMLFSSAVTTTVCTLVGSGGGSTTGFAGSGTKGCWFRGAGRRESAQRLAAGAMRLRPLGLRAAVRTRALRAIAPGLQGSLDATAHDGCGSRSGRWRSAKAQDRHGEMAAIVLPIRHSGGPEIVQRLMGLSGTRMQSRTMRAFEARKFSCPGRGAAPFAVRR